MSDVTDGIRDYLASGGLFNPELMDHQRVRDLLIESRDEIERLYYHHKIAVDNWTLEAQTVKQQEDEIHALKAEIKRLRGLLRDAVLIDDGDMSVNVDEWMMRVREALGDK